MESDFYRLLFQGAGLVSFLNWVEYGPDQVKQPGFVLPLAYIGRNFQVRIYLMREEDGQV
jgi:hypothetical protein